MMNSGLVLGGIVLLCGLASEASAQHDRGILLLDNITFDRVLGRAAAFVRIDKEYSYGEVLAPASM